MALSALDDKSKKPTNDDLTAVLGRTRQLWDHLVNDVAQTYTPVVQEWGFAGEKYGWSLRLKRKKRTILYLIPQQRHFLCAFVFGGKATEAAREADLPAETIEAINDAPVYGEGRGFRLKVSKRKDVETMAALTAIKMAN